MSLGNECGLRPWRENRFGDFVAGWHNVRPPHQVDERNQVLLAVIAEVFHCHLCVFTACSWRRDVQADAELER